MNCKESFSQSKPCPFWGGDHCCDEEEYVDVESGDLQCRYNPSSVHINEYREISGEVEAELPATDNSPQLAIALMNKLNDVWDNDQIAILSHVKGIINEWRSATAKRA